MEIQEPNCFPLMAVDTLEEMSPAQAPLLHIFQVQNEGTVRAQAVSFPLCSMRESFKACVHINKMKVLLIIWKVCSPGDKKSNAGSVVCRFKDLSFSDRFSEQRSNQAL